MQSFLSRAGSVQVWAGENAQGGQLVMEASARHLGRLAVAGQQRQVEKAKLIEKAVDGGRNRIKAAMRSASRGFQQQAADDDLIEVRIGGVDEGVKTGKRIRRHTKEFSGNLKGRQRADEELLWPFRDLGFAPDSSVQIPRFKCPATARPLALAGILLAFAVTPFASFAIGFIRAPTLSDVATDPADPPVFQGEAAPLHPEQLEDAPAIVAAFPELGGRSYRAAPEQVVDAVETLMRSRGWDPIARFGRPDDGGVQVEGVATTLLLRFEMDVAARIADDGDSTFVDVRSASRFGRHDMGANAELIRRFLADLDAEMLARLGT